MNYYIDEKGFYGDFGGYFIPEMLYHNITELQKNYKNIINDKDFKNELNSLLINYVGRPSPLFYCNNLSSYYKTKIYLKREDLNHTGSHKINNTIGQALLARRLGKKKIIAETGAGQHGVATATICALLNIECIIFMGETDMIRQSSNVSRMKMLGAKIIPALSGNKTLKDAVNEAIRYWINNPDSYYLIGSVVGPHPYPDIVCRFQSIIGEEIAKQLLEKEGNSLPNYIIACIGGGSNSAGAFFNFLEHKSVKLIAVEASGLGIDNPKNAVTTFNGTKGILHGSMTLVMQTNDGQVIEPYSISAGLDYPGIGPIHAHLFKTKRSIFMHANDEEALKAAYQLVKLEGIIPALESAHALAILSKKRFQENEIIIINLSGRGDKDIETYIKRKN